jgi:hypothetical protein
MMHPRNVQVKLKDLISCKEWEICDGEPMPVPTDVCPPIAWILGEGAVDAPAPGPGLEQGPAPA